MSYSRRRLCEKLDLIMHETQHMLDQAGTGLTIVRPVYTDETRYALKSLFMFCKRLHDTYYSWYVRDRDSEALVKGIRSMCERLPVIGVK